MKKIREAILDVAYDNGVINRTISAEAVMSHTLPLALSVLTADEVESVESFLFSLTPDQFAEFTMGEHRPSLPSEPDRAAAEKLLQAAFDNFPFPFGNQA